MPDHDSPGTNGPTWHADPTAPNWQPDPAGEASWHPGAADHSTGQPAPSAHGWHPGPDDHGAHHPGPDGHAPRPYDPVGHDWQSAPPGATSWQSAPSGHGAWHPGPSNHPVGHPDPATQSPWQPGPFGHPDQFDHGPRHTEPYGHPAHHPDPAGRSAHHPDRVSPGSWNPAPSGHPDQVSPGPWQPGPAAQGPWQPGPDGRGAPHHGSSGLPGHPDPFGHGPWQSGPAAQAPWYPDQVGHGAPQYGPSDHTAGHRGPTGHHAPHPGPDGRGAPHSNPSHGAAGHPDPGGPAGHDARRPGPGRRGASSYGAAGQGDDPQDGTGGHGSPPARQAPGRAARRAAAAAGSAAPGAPVPPGRAHGRARLVKVVALCAATAAGSMLILRGNEALAGLGAPTAPHGKPAAAAPADAPDPGRVLQIVAHPDDDLYFMNPDLRYSIAAGHPVTSVYLTSGEADGINAGAAKEASTPANKPAYAEARQNGIRAAYAQMATGDRSSPWKRTVVPTKGGGHAEVDVLVAKPEVNLVWLQLREAGHVYADVPDSLHGLWDGKVPRLESMLASGTPVKQRFTYTKDQVVQTLVGFLAQYKPTTIRSQDPTPGRFPDTKRYTDHQDHFYGARFAQLALASYAKDVKDRPHFAVQNYLGYFNGSLPSALDPDEAKAKLDILDTYAWLDKQNHCGSDAGCGDLKVADHPAGNRWTDSINYARGTSTSWLTSDSRHGLWAFKVLDGQVAVWHRAGPIGTWSGPRLLPGTGMDQGISTVTLKDGRIAAFGTRTSFGAKPTDYKREVVYALQKGPGSEEFGDWQSLGTPETADENWTSDISAPAVSVDGAGQLAAYVRDGSYTLRGRVQAADGSWGPWEQYGGSDLHGTPAAATDGAGRRMVFVSTTKTVLGWVQPKPGAPLGPATPTGLPDTTLPLTAEGREGGVRLWFRKPGSGNVRTALVTGEGGLKVNSLTDLGGLQGFGSVTASGHVLAGRSAGGLLGADVGSGRPWRRSPLMFVGAPSSTMTGRNTVSLAVVGLDARLYVTSSADEPDAYLAPWLPVGPRNQAP
ncbi:PIG-L family deacetylase [Streptomyces sp. NPDC048340]|uniref:PIG-L family deacetylase n=1 Tax=Streptomyces sp. NPDC048340 TaxID=3365537 RepID=UPI003716B661